MTNILDLIRGYFSSDYRNRDWLPSRDSTTLTGKWQGKTFSYKMDNNKIKNIINVANASDESPATMLGLTLYEGREDMGNNDANNLNPTRVGAGRLKRMQSSPLYKKMKEKYNSNPEYWNNKEIWNTTMNPLMTALYLKDRGLQGYNKGSKFYIDAVNTLGAQAYKNLGKFNLGKNIYEEEVSMSYKGDKKPNSLFGILQNQAEAKSGYLKNKQEYLKKLSSVSQDRELTKDEQLNFYNTAGDMFNTIHDIPKLYSERKNKIYDEYPPTRVGWVWGGEPNTLNFNNAQSQYRFSNYTKRNSSELVKEEQEPEWLKKAMTPEMRNRPKMYKREEVANFKERDKDYYPMFNLWDTKANSTYKLDAEDLYNHERAHSEQFQNYGVRNFALSSTKGKLEYNADLVALYTKAKLENMLDYPNRVIDENTKLFPKNIEVLNSGDTAGYWQIGSLMKNLSDQYKKLHSEKIERQILNRNNSLKRFAE